MPSYVIQDWSVVSKDDTPKQARMMVNRDCSECKVHHCALTTAPYYVEEAIKKLLLANQATYAEKMRYWDDAILSINLAILTENPSHKTI